MLFLTPNPFSDYELIDTGGGEKLERFGAYILLRPEPQAAWPKTLTEDEWRDRANAIFEKTGNSQEKGEWVRKVGLPDRWAFQYQNGTLLLKGHVALTTFKHVGVFPEQAVHWDYIAHAVTALRGEPVSVLNLFAYTGFSSLAAKAMGAEVTHVDSVKPVVSWARSNMEMSGFDNIRWIVDDAMKFVKREVRRGKKYHGILLDPPAYGRGPEGEKWLLNEQINEMISLVAELLDERRAFLVTNLYSLGFSPLILENLLHAHFPEAKTPELGELFLTDSFGKKLPLGVFGRFILGA